MTKVVKANAAGLSIKTRQLGKGLSAWEEGLGDVVWDEAAGFKGGLAVYIRYLSDKPGYTPEKKRRGLCCSLIAGEGRKLRALELLSYFVQHFIFCARGEDLS